MKYLFDQGLMEEYQRNNPKQIGDFQSYVWMVSEGVFLKCLNVNNRLWVWIIWEIK